jgi:rhodanese-related sulfurtransferase
MFWWWPFGKVPEVSPNRLDTMRKDVAAPPQIIDVRTTMEWRSGHIAGAIHVPITELGSRVTSLHLDGTRPIVAICRAAHRSVPAVRLLSERGFRNACQLQGGMIAWRAAGLPIEGEGGEAPASDDFGPVGSGACSTSRTSGSATRGRRASTSSPKTRSSPSRGNGILSHGTWTARPLRARQCRGSRHRVCTPMRWPRGC